MEDASTIIVEATIGGVEHTIRYDVPTEKGGFITGIVLEPREPVEMPRAEKVRPSGRGANGAGGTSDEDPEVTVGIYQPPNKDLAAKRMREAGVRPRHRRSAAAEHGLRSHLQVFGSGITSTDPPQDYAVCMLCFTLASFWYYHMIRTASGENKTTTERLPGLLASPSAHCHVWQPAGAGWTQVRRRPRRHARDCRADTLMMFALSALALYHFFRKRRARDEADLHAITMDDYSIVSRTSPNVTEDRLRKHFEKFGVVNEIVMGYDLREMMALPEASGAGRQPRDAGVHAEARERDARHRVRLPQGTVGQGVRAQGGRGRDARLGPQRDQRHVREDKNLEVRLCGQPRAYYARHGTITNDFDAYANMLKTWSTRDNVPVEDFGVYGSRRIQELANPWVEHNADARRRFSARFGGVRARLGCGRASRLPR